MHRVLVEPLPLSLRYGAGVGEQYPFALHAGGRYRTQAPPVAPSGKVIASEIAQPNERDRIGRHWRRVVRPTIDRAVDAHALPALATLVDADLVAIALEEVAECLVWYPTGFSGA